MVTESEIEEYLEDGEEVTTNVADPKAVNNARKAAARKKQVRADFVRRMMDDPSGRLWIYDKLVLGHIAEPTHTPGDPYSTAFKEGERNFANNLLSDINEYAPDRYMTMLTEGRTEK